MSLWQDSDFWTRLEREGELKRLREELEGMRQRFEAAQADCVRWSVRVGVLEERLARIRLLAEGRGE